MNNIYIDVNFYTVTRGDLTSSLWRVLDYDYRVVNDHNAVCSLTFSTDNWIRLQ